MDAIGQEIKINQVYFDPETKDYVKITNGIDQDGKFVPTEGLVHRVIGVKSYANGMVAPQVAVTYIKVKDEGSHLHPASGRNDGGSVFNDVAKVTSTLHIGRV